MGRFDDLLRKPAPSNTPAAAAPITPPTPARPALPVAAPAVQVSRPSTATTARALDGRQNAGAVRGRGSFDVTTPFSDEQQEVIESQAKKIVAKAFAGAGKTTCAVGFAAARRDQNVLYMPFGKSMQLEASERFPSNTVCQTINSAAFAATGNLRHKLTNSLSPMVLRKEMNLRNHRQAGLVLSVLNTYLVSADDDVFLKHATAAFDNWNASDSEVHEAIEFARLAWSRMRDPSDKMPVSHDVLLKAWAMTNPVLPYDTIIFDEAQDTNPVTAHIIRRQSHATVLYIGDPHQSIYGFRGAFNAMEDMANDPQAEHHHLSKTWRFGPRIADIANTILQELKGETVPIIGMGTDGVHKPGERVTVLSRTNAQLFREAAARRGKGVHWVGANGIRDYGIDRVLQAYSLYKSDVGAVTDLALRNFNSWAELERYAEDARDPDIKILVNLVNEFQNDTPTLVHDLKTNEARDDKDAELILTSAHKSKGLDWDHVKICDDFKVLLDAEETLAKDANAKINDQEVNLLYVAYTRAKKTVHLNQETKDWFSNLDRHRADRERAQRRAQARSTPDTTSRYFR